MSCYEEGLFVGYRFYDSENEKCLLTQFPFGFGLSYSKFEYSALNCEKDENGVKVSFDITNVSSVDGAEIAQVYVREVHPKVRRPFKELKQFARVNLKAGESKKVELWLDKHAFEFYSTALDKWTHTPGKFEILVGSSSKDILLEAAVEIE
jgi:beta-glucosidase